MPIGTGPADGVCGSCTHCKVAAQRIDKDFGQVIDEGGWLFCFQSDGQGMIDPKMRACAIYQEIDDPDDALRIAHPRERV